MWGGPAQPGFMVQPQKLRVMPMSVAKKRRLVTALWTCQTAVQEPIANSINVDADVGQAVAAVKAGHDRQGRHELP